MYIYMLIVQTYAWWLVASCVYCYLNIYAWLLFLQLNYNNYPSFADVCVTIKMYINLLSSVDIVVLLVADKHWSSHHPSLSNINE